MILCAQKPAQVITMWYKIPFSPTGKKKTPSIDINRCVDREGVSDNEML
jgi:hypothetical protein